MFLTIIYHSQKMFDNRTVLILFSPVCLLNNFKIGQTWNTFWLYMYNVRIKIRCFLLDLFYCSLVCTLYVNRKGVKLQIFFISMDHFKLQFLGPHIYCTLPIMYKTKLDFYYFYYHLYKLSFLCPYKWPLRPYKADFGISWCAVY